MVIERFFESRDALIAAVKAQCESALQVAVEERGEASFLVSGGSSPEPLYKALSQSDLPWESIYVALVDERWVDFNHDKSNEAFVARSLMQNKAASANLIGMKNTAETAIDGLADCEAAYQQLAQPFDITILGMGSDGHTASLFPHAEGLAEALSTHALCSAINAKESEVTGAVTERITLSLTGLLATKQLLLMITGEEKLAVFRAAQAEGAVEDMPIRALLQQDLPLTVYWAP